MWNLNFMVTGNSNLEINGNFKENAPTENILYQLTKPKWFCSILKIKLQENFS